MVGTCLVALAAVVVARPAQAEHETGSGCGDFGGLGVMLGTGAGLGVATVSALVFPAIARASTPRLRYWPGVGWTMLGGTVGAVGSGVLLLQGCPESSLYVPSIVALLSSGITTAIWASATKPKPPPVTLLVTTPRTGHGMLLGAHASF